MVRRWWMGRPPAAVDHTLFTFDPETNSYGGKFPPKKFYQLNMLEAPVKLHPDYGKTTVWGFDGRCPGR